MLNCFGSKRIEATKLPITMVPSSLELRESGTRDLTTRVLNTAVSIPLSLKSDPRLSTLLGTPSQVRLAPGSSPQDLGPDNRDKPLPALPATELEQAEENNNHCSSQSSVMFDHVGPKAAEATGFLSSRSSFSLDRYLAEQEDWSVSKALESQTGSANSQTPDMTSQILELESAFSDWSTVDESPEIGARNNAWLADAENESLRSFATFASHVLNDNENEVEDSMSICSSQWSQVRRDMEDHMWHYLENLTCPLRSYTLDTEVPPLFTNPWLGTSFSDPFSSTESEPESTDLRRLGEELALVGQLPPEVPERSKESDRPTTAEPSLAPWSVFAMRLLTDASTVSLPGQFLLDVGDGPAPLELPSPSQKAGLIENHFATDRDDGKTFRARLATAARVLPLPTIEGKFANRFAAVVDGNLYSSSENNHNLAFQANKVLPIPLQLGMSSATIFSNRDSELLHLTSPTSSVPGTHPASLRPISTKRDTILSARESLLLHVTSATDQVAVGPCLNHRIDLARRASDRRRHRQARRNCRDSSRGGFVRRMLRKIRQSFKKRSGLADGLWL